MMIFLGKYWPYILIVLGLPFVAKGITELKWALSTKGREYRMTKKELSRYRKNFRHSFGYKFSWKEIIPWWASEYVVQCTERIDSQKWGILQERVDEVLGELREKVNDAKKKHRVLEDKFKKVPEMSGFRRKLKKHKKLSKKITRVKNDEGRWALELSRAEMAAEKFGFITVRRKEKEEKGKEEKKELIS